MSHLWELLSAEEIALMLRADPTFKLPAGCGRVAARMAEAWELVRREDERRRERSIELPATPAEVAA